MTAPTRHRGTAPAHRDPTQPRRLSTFVVVLLTVAGASGGWLLGGLFSPPAASPYVAVYPRIGSGWLSAGTERRGTLALVNGCLTGSDAESRELWVFPEWATTTDGTTIVYRGDTYRDGDPITVVGAPMAATWARVPESCTEFESFFRVR